jgi:hypothetical protein
VVVSCMRGGVCLGSRDVGREVLGISLLMGLGKAV